MIFESHVSLNRFCIVFLQRHICHCIKIFSKTFSEKPPVPRGTSQRKKRKRREDFALLIRYRSSITNPANLPLFLLEFPMADAPRPRRCETRIQNGRRSVRRTYGTIRTTVSPPRFDPLPGVARQSFKLALAG